jgi:MSHA type pilus biogenesis protein MshL
MGISERGMMKKFVVAFMLFFAFSCAAPQQEVKVERETGIIEKAFEEAHSVEVPAQTAPEEPVPKFRPVREESSPLGTKRISISARNTPLRDVLHAVAETAGLNIVLEKGVDPETPVTITFRDVSIADALKIIFDSADYFYSVDGNILVVKAMDTEMFEIGQPNVNQTYKMSVGGDILSGVASSGDESSESLSGDVSAGSESDSTAFRFWDAVEKALRTIITRDTGPSGDQGPEPSLVVNRMAGTVMVTATKKNLVAVRNYINNLKKVLNRQVLIEARIVEVQLSEGLKYGIDWSAVGRVVNDIHMNAATNVFSSVVNSFGPNFEIGITDNENVTILLKALEEQGDVRTLSNPRLNIMNGQTAMLSVGRNTTFISRVETSTTASDGSAPLTTFTVDTNSVLSGIMFGIVPYINSNNEVTLNITPIVSNLVDLEEKLVGTGGNSVAIKLPTVDLREMSTTIKVLDGQLIIIGGLIDREESEREDRIPIVGRLPLIGKVFSRVDRSYRNTELVIMLIPRIIG